MPKRKKSVFGQPQSQREKRLRRNEAEEVRVTRLARARERIAQLRASQSETELQIERE